MFLNVSREEVCPIWQSISCSINYEILPLSFTENYHVMLPYPWQFSSGIEGILCKVKVQNGKHTWGLVSVGMAIVSIG